MVTFPFQDDVLTWMVWCIKEQKEGIIEKSRDVGASWMWVFLTTWYALFHKGVTTLTMSQNADDVDNRTAKSIFEKIRINLRTHPVWMRRGWEERGEKDKMMLVGIPETSGEMLGAVAKGAAGRGGRGIPFFDEFAHIDEAPQILEAGTALSPCKFFISTPRGENNEFARMARDPKANKKTLHWTVHPLRNALWEKKQREKPSMTDEYFAQEYEVSYTKSTIGRVFPDFKRATTEEGEWCHIQGSDDDPFYDYDPNYDVYTCSDLGMDTTVFFFFQVKPTHPDFTHLHDAGMGEQRNCVVIFDELYAKRESAYYFRERLNSIRDTKGYHYAEHISDIRTAQKAESSTANGGWGAMFMEDRGKIQERHNIDVGDEILLVGTRVKESETLQTMTTLLRTPGSICWNPRCGYGIEAMTNWSFEINPYERDRDGSPLLKHGAKTRHDKYSHPGKALLYGMQYLYGAKTYKSKKKEKLYVDWHFVQKRVMGL